MDDSIFVVTFEGSQTIEKAEMVKNTLLKAINGKKKEILLNLSKVDKIDLSFLQLLYSASLQATVENKIISIHGPIPRTILDMIHLSGFDRKTNNKSDHLFADFIKGKD